MGKIMVVVLKTACLGHAKGELIKVSDDHAKVLLKKDIIETPEGWTKPEELDKKEKSKKSK
jgi:hypothetical protein